MFKFDGQLWYKGRLAYAVNPLISFEVIPHSSCLVSRYACKQALDENENLREALGGVGHKPGQLIKVSSKGYEWINGFLPEDGIYVWGSTVGFIWTFAEDWTGREMMVKGEDMPLVNITPIDKNIFREVPLLGSAWTRRGGDNTIYIVYEHRNNRFHLRSSGGTCSFCNLMLSELYHLFLPA